MKYSMRENPDGTHTLMRHNEPAAGGSDNAHFEFWAQIQRLRERLAATEQVAADATCNCGYILPSHNGHHSPDVHSPACRYRQAVEDRLKKMNAEWQ